MGGPEIRLDDVATGEHLLRRALRDQPAAVENGDTRTEPLHELHVVFDEKHAGPEVPDRGLDIGVDEESLAPLQARSGLVVLLGATRVASRLGISMSISETRAILQCENAR